MILVFIDFVNNFAVLIFSKKNKNNKQ